VFTPSTRRARALVLLPILSLVALSACGSDDGGSAAAAAPATETTVPPAATATEPAATDPAATDPAVTDPAATDPAATDPAVTDPPVDLSDVTLRVGDQVNITQTGLEVAGLADTPYTIEWSAFTSGPPMLEALAADAIDIGGVGDAPPIFAAAGGAAIKAVFVTRSPQVNHGILVHGDSDITDVAGLKGKTVAVAKGSAAHWILLKALQDNGLTVDDIEIAYLQPADAQAAFQSGNVDAWVIWDPYSALAQSQGAKLIVTGEQLGILGLGFQVSSDAALADPAKVAAIRDFLGRLRQAQAWQRAHKDDWAAKYSELTKLPIDLAKQMLSVDSVPLLIDDETIGAEQAEADAFFAAGVIPAAVDFASVADDRFNDVTTAG